MTDTAPTIAGLLRHARRLLDEAGLDAAAEAEHLLCHALGCSRTRLFTSPDERPAPDARARFNTLLARRASGTPLAHLLGTQPFRALELTVTPDTLIPRADSETLVEAVLEKGLRPARVLDLGTGTGALLLAVLREFPDAWGVGVDCAPEAAALAARNAARNGLGGRAAFLAGDWAQALDGRFDLVLSNPPYIPAADITGLMPEVARHEPRSALDGGDDGLDAYRRICAALPRLLAPGGFALLELGQGQDAAVSALAMAQGLHVAGLHADLSGISRAILLDSGQKPIGDTRASG